MNAADLLDKQKCLDALAALRHAKWFQARASIIPSCVLLLRVLKELKSREAKFACISSWAMELLLERCMTTAVSPMGPGDALRRFFESLASGLILPGGPGLSDPCEKDPIDSFHSLNPQSRENLTSYAQLCLRMIAFNKIHKILDIDVIVPEDQPLSLAAGAPRKRPLNSIDAEGGAEGKKEKTDE
ncbi:ZFR [Bugula neritina]|uniref:ZFR n=1 Tax=Bugula neritina TaxID=10212 RepID=A0A7J7JAC3_BUGNE|nr:ZFR [Bugula neritina]